MGPASYCKVSMQRGEVNRAEMAKDQQGGGPLSKLQGESEAVSRRVHSHRSLDLSPKKNMKS